MNIVFVTNTFTPHVGGVARSIEAFTRELRGRGHRLLTIAPEFDEMPAQEQDVIRVPSIHNFNESDFSVVLPLPKGLTERVEAFAPDIIHSHHPFLLGMTALRLARTLRAPLAFTHHTLYEQYTHYVTSETELASRFIINLATSYANLSDQVIAPSESIAQLLRQRGVKRPLDVVPTGVQAERFACGDGTRFRREHNIDEQAFVVGHMGRLAPEKNLEFLTAAVVCFLTRHEDALFVLVGGGPSEESIRRAVENAGVAGRLCMTGVLQDGALANAMKAMDLFCFASKSETQGMVLTEAMAAGLPVVALDAFGVRDVMRHDHNGRLVTTATTDAFCEALDHVYSLPAEGRARLAQGALATAERYSLSNSVDRITDRYTALAARGTRAGRETGFQELEQFTLRLKTEWDILRSVTLAGSDALGVSVDSDAGNWHHAE